MILVIGGMGIARPSPPFIGFRGGALILMLSFGLIPDLLDGHGDDKRRTSRQSKIEQQIRASLRNLGSGFLCLYDVETPHGTILVVVISRDTGVFLIEAKIDRKHRSPDDGLPCAGGCSQEIHVLDQCTAKVDWLRYRIAELAGEKPLVTPMLVVPYPFVPPDLYVDGVRVLNPASLLTALTECGSGRRNRNRVWDARDLIADTLVG